MIVGAGIVGLSVAYHLRRQGVAVIVIDRAPEGDKASYGNAAGIAVTEVVPASVPGLIWRVPGWLIDPLGPLAIRPSHALKLLVFEEMQRNGPSSGAMELRSRN